MMVQRVTSTHVRTAALMMASCGVLCSFAFFAFHSFASGLGGFPVRFFVSDALPYLVAALAGTLAKNRAVGGICAAASLCVLALGVDTYIEWIRFPVPKFVNDIELSTYPLKWLFSVTAVFVAAIAFVPRKTKHAQASL